MNNQQYSVILLLCLGLSACLVPMEQQLAPIEQACERQWLMPIYDPIRDKVELLPKAQGAAQHLFNQQKASETEQEAIKQMAVLLDDCQSQLAAVTYQYDVSQALRENAQKVADLENLMQVHDGKISWGEFTRRRYALVTEHQTLQAAEQEQRRREREQRQREREAEQAKQREAAREHMQQLQSHYQALAILRRRDANTLPLTERWRVDSLLLHDYKTFFRGLRKDGYIIDYQCKNQGAEYECAVYY